MGTNMGSTIKEQTIILDKYEEVKYTIEAKSNKGAAAKCKKDSWQKIKDCAIA